MISKYEMEVMHLQRAQVWFLEAVKQSGFDLYERTIAMLEGALHHKCEAESRLDNAYTPVKSPGNQNPVLTDTDRDSLDFYAPQPLSYQHPGLSSNDKLIANQPNFSVFNQPFMPTSTSKNTLLSHPSQ